MIHQFRDCTSNASIARKMFVAFVTLVLIVGLLPSHVFAEPEDQTTPGGTPATITNNQQVPGNGQPSDGGPANNENTPTKTDNPSPAGKENEDVPTATGDPSQTNSPINDNQPKLLSAPQPVQAESVLQPQANKAIEGPTRPSESEWTRDTIALTPNGQIVVDKVFALKNCTINSNMTSYDYAIDVQSGSFTMEGGIFQYPSEAAKGIVHAASGTSATLSTVSINGGVPSSFNGANIIQIDQNAQVTLGGHAARINYFKDASIQNDGTFVVSEGSEAHFPLNIISLKGTGTPLTVESGATLTIYKGTITMQDNQGIVVKSGGKLELDGSTIVAAGSRIPVTVEKGGVLEVKNGATFQINRQGSASPAATHLYAHKHWDLEDSQPSSNASVAVRLYSGPSATEQEFTGATTWVDASNGWTADFGEWPTYWNNNEQVPAVYTIRELDDNSQEVTSGSIALISGTEYMVTYAEPHTATKDGELTLDVTNTLKFTSVSLEATKTLVGCELAGGDFTFRLLGANNEVLQQKTNDADGLVAFDPIILPAPGTYSYAVEEVPGNESGMTYDTSKHEAIVTVTQEEDGSFATHVANRRDGKDVGTIAFQNEVEVAKTYEPVSANVVVTKTLEGRPLEAGEFTFHLDDAHGESRQSKANDANGIVKFDALTFEAPGTYVYHVREDEGNPAITYDSAYHVVTFHVHDAGDGKLEVQKTIELNDKHVDALAFDNVVDGVSEHEPVMVVLEATKTLEGRTLKNDEFSFQLDDAHGEAIQTATNNAKGSVSFDALNVDKPGTYVWVIREVAGSEKGMTYDKRVFDATAKIEEGSNGELVVSSITYTLDGNKVDGAAFLNKYETSAGGGGTPAKETNNTKTTGSTVTPKTGDASLPIGAVSGGALLALCAGVFVCRNGERR